MNIPATIRSLYKPVQPAIKQSADNVSYAEIAPEPFLQHLIYCYWQLKTTERIDEDFVYRVVADGCIDIFFSLEDPEDSYVMGFSKQYTEFGIGNNFNYVGIRFLPTMFPHLFNIDASQITDRFEALKNLLPDTNEFIRSNCHQAQPLSLLKILFDNYFRTIVENHQFDFDGRLYDAIEIILNKQGVVDIEQDLKTGISQRQLRRLFDFYIGDSAKTFSKVVRFQNILRAKPSSESLRKNKVFYDSGYFDQSHFIKDFKTLYGLTPSKAFREEQ